MPRKVLGGLIQAAAPITDPSAPIEKIRQAALDAHIPLIEEAGKKGVQILGLQEVFNGPYFCPSQDAHWYDIAEAVPGPMVVTEAVTAELYGAHIRFFTAARSEPLWLLLASRYDTATIG